MNQFAAWRNRGGITRNASALPWFGAGRTLRLKAFRRFSCLLIDFPGVVHERFVMVDEAATSSSSDIIQTLVSVTVERKIEILEELPNEQELLPGVTVSALLRHIQLQFAPAPPRPGCHLSEDVVYGTAGSGGRNLTQHLYTHESGGPRPGVVFVHGGGWANGSPNMVSAIASDVASRGYVTTTVSYRLSGEACWPAALEDVKCAVRWMRAHADKIGVDPERIAISGESAGGHLSAMVALTPGRWEGDGGWAEESSAAQLAVLYCPAVDLRRGGIATPGYESARNFLGDLSLASEASPITHVTASAPPIRTVVGEKDELTTPDAARSFHQALDDVGVPNQLEVIPGLGHGVVLQTETCVRAATDSLATHFPAARVH